MSGSPLLPYIGAGFRGDHRFLWAYLEAVDVISGETLFGPSGDRLAVAEPLQGLDRRLRFSCVGYSQFREADARIERLGERPTSAQRIRRKSDLLREFGEASLPVVDVYFKKGRARSRLFSNRLARWFALVLDENSTPTDDILAVIGDPAGGGEDAIARLNLLAIAEEETEARLRDVFSLAHVSDVGRDDDPESEPPITPFDPPPKGSVLVIDSRSARLEELEQSDAFVEPTRGSSADELTSTRNPSQQRIVISQ